MSPRVFRVPSGSLETRRRAERTGKGRGSRVIVARRSSPVRTESPSGEAARPVAADEVGSRELELASANEARVHLARGLNGPRVAR